MKLLNQFIRYEHKEWVKLHKLHLSLGSISFGAITVVVIFAVSSNKPTSAAFNNASLKQTSSSSQSNAKNNSNNVAVETKSSNTSSTSPATVTTKNSPQSSKTIPQTTDVSSPKKHAERDELIAQLYNDNNKDYFIRIELRDRGYGDLKENNIKQIRFNLGLTKKQASKPKS